MARRMIETTDDVAYAELYNGTHIVIKQRRNLPLVSMAIGALGGSLLESVERAGYTSLMARTSIKGTARRTAAQIADAAEHMGGSVSPSGGGDTIDWAISVPSRHFTAALDLLSDVAFNASFPEAELEVERKLTLADLHHVRDDMYRYPLRLCLQAAFEDHPYGFTLETIEAGVGRAKPEDLLGWRNERLYPLPWVFVVGDVDPERAVREIEAHLPTPNESSIWIAPPTKWPEQRRQLVDERDKAQTAIALAFPGPDRNHEDVYALQVLANAVGGLGGRFFEELRSKRSLAYTVSLMPMARVSGGAFVAYIATSPEREDEARAGLLEQFARLVEEPIPEADLVRAQRYTIGTWHIRNQTNSAQLNELMQAHMLGPGMQEILEFEAHIRAVDTARVLDVAQRYFRPEVAVEGVVRGTGKSR